MKILLTTLAAICTFSLTCSAQWTASGIDIYNTNTGNVGVGATTPLSKLSISIPGNSGYNEFRIGSNEASARDLIIRKNTTTPFDANIIWSAHPTANAGSLNFFSSDQASGARVTFNANGNVGIGTTAPAAKLHVAGPEIRLTGVGTSGAGSSGTFTIYDSDGITRRGYFGDASGGNTDLYLTAENGGGLYVATSGATRMYYTPTGNIGIGTINPDQLLTVNGTIHSKSVVVDLSIVPDYVFKSVYRLPSLDYVENYIEKNSHLPEVPSEAEIQKNGLDVGKMNAVLLKKVEELTLYVIDQQKRISALEKKLNTRRQRKR